VAKKKKVLRCPVCRVEVRANRLEIHMEKVHPGGDDRPKGARNGVPGRSRAGTIAAAAIIAVVVIAAVGYYYINLSAEEGEEPFVPPVSSGVYPTQYAYLDVASRGTIVIGLYGNETPNTVQNFINLVAQNFFVGTIFHRIASGFVIQGGGFTPDLEMKPVTTPPIELEINPKLHNYRGTVAMARTDNPDSATTQFFINLVDNTPGKLDPGGYSKEGYAVFGVVVRGMDVVDNIAGARTEYSPSNPKEKSQPITEERGTLVITSTRLMPTPDG